MNEEILKRIDALAAKLGVTADHIWAVLVKQARVEFMEWVIWSALWFLLSITLAWAARSLYKKYKDEIEPVFLFAAVPSGLLFFMAIGCLSNTMTLIMNPEYWALTQITKMIGGK